MLVDEWQPPLTGGSGDDAIGPLRDYALSGAPFVTPDVPVEHWYPTLGAFLDGNDPQGRYALVVDGDPATYVAHTVRLGTETNDAERPYRDEPPSETLDARLEFITEDERETGIDLLDLRAIGRLGPVAAT